MNKKDFIFPGVILGLVIITGFGILLTHSSTPQLIPNTLVDTSTTASTSTSTTPSSTTPGKTPSAPHTPSAYYPYGTVTLALNQAAQFQDGVAIRPLSVLGDSRCPADVQCIQAGTVRISLKVNEGGVSKTETIELGQSIHVGADTITFESVSPQRSQSSSITSGSYRFTFKVVHGGTVSAGPCFVGGCSAEVCSDSPNAVSNCIYSPRFACYKKTTCERQSSGSCGWTQTPQLKSCLANPPQM